MVPSLSKPISKASGKIVEYPFSFTLKNKLPSEYKVNIRSVPLTVHFETFTTSEESQEFSVSALAVFV